MVIRIIFLLAVGMSESRTSLQLVGRMCGCGWLGLITPWVATCLQPDGGGGGLLFHIAGASVGKPILLYPNVTLKTEGRGIAAFGLYGDPHQLNLGLWKAERSKNTA